MFGVSFTCMCDGRGGTGWALLLGHRCSIQVRSSENSRVDRRRREGVSYVPLSSASRWQRVTQEDGQGECRELPSDTSVQRVCS